MDISFFFFNIFFRLFFQVYNSSFYIYTKHQTSFHGSIVLFSLSSMTVLAWSSQAVGRPEVSCILTE